MFFPHLWPNGIHFFTSLNLGYIYIINMPHFGVQIPHFGVQMCLIWVIWGTFFVIFFHYPLLSLILFSIYLSTSYRSCEVRYPLYLSHPVPLSPYPSSHLPLSHPIPPAPYPSQTLPLSPYPSLTLSLSHPFTLTPYPPLNPSHSFTQFLSHSVCLLLHLSLTLFLSISHHYIFLSHVCLSLCLFLTLSLPLCPSLTLSLSNSVPL